MSGFTYSDWAQGATPPPGFTVYGSDLPGAATPSYEPPPPPRRRRSRGGGFRGFLWLLVASLLFGGVRYGVAEAIDRARGVRRFAYGTTLHTPARIGTTPRLTTRLAKQTEATVEAEAPKGSSPQVALYGRGSTARYYLVAALSGERTSSEVYDVFGGGAPELRNLIEYGPGRPVSGLTCGKMRVGSRHGAACAWSSRLSNGMLMDYDHPDLKALAKRTLVVIDQVNGEA